MPPDILLPLLIGALFGANLILSGLADPDRIVGTLRLKDFHAMRVIAVFVLTGMLGTWVLSLLGLANFDVKPAVLVAAAVGGAVLGIGFGTTGYCPGTGLACAAAGRLDALVTVVGMFGGAMVYILTYESFALPLEKAVDYGKVTLAEFANDVPAVTELDAAYLVLPIVIVGAVALLLTRPSSPLHPSSRRR
jgi:hypothetical protein